MIGIHPLVSDQSLSDVALEVPAKHWWTKKQRNSPETKDDPAVFHEKCSTSRVKTNPNPTCDKQHHKEVEENISEQGSAQSDEVPPGDGCRRGSRTNNGAKDAHAN